MQASPALVPVALSALPILVTIFALAFGVRSLRAALLGIAAAALGVAIAFPVPLEDVAPAVLQWSPLLLEVLLIIGGGLLLAEAIGRGGGQRDLATWLGARSGGGDGGIATALLVVHGVTPFAESLTGFGIGVTIAIPLLVRLGWSPGRAVALGLLGLCAVPWGSMAPGMLVAATMADVSFHDLGVASAVLSAIPFVATGVVAAWIASTPSVRDSDAESGEGRGSASPIPTRRLRAVALGIASGLVLTATVTGANAVFGTAPAGALGALAVVALHLIAARVASARREGEASPLGAAGRRALLSYAVLLGGVLASGAVIRLLQLPETWRLLSSPALWLFLATLCFMVARRGLSENESPAFAPRALLRSTASSWSRVAPVAALFIVLGVLMAVSGMARTLAETLALLGPAYLALAPAVGALGGFVTGSNTGANAMFASTQAEIAHSLGADPLWFMAAHNVGASFLVMPSPGKIELGIELAPTGAADHRRWIWRVILGTCAAVVVLLGAVNLALGLLL